MAITPEGKARYLMMTVPEVEQLLAFAKEMEDRGENRIILMYRPNGIATCVYAGDPVKFFEDKEIRVEKSGWGCSDELTGIPPYARDICDYGSW